MMRSLYAAVSGLSGNQKAMDVIGNNIANVNTIGFKCARAVFQDMLSQTLSTGKQPTDGLGGINPRQVGTGTYLVAVDNIFSQGTTKNTASFTDLAIQGNGFFVVRGHDQQQYFTRAGDFNFDKTGYLVNPSGNKVQGWMADPVTGKLQVNSMASDIFVSDAHKIMQPKATTMLHYHGVLSTQSTASEIKFKPMKTTAADIDSIFNVWGKNGKLGLTETNGTVTVRAHATGVTNLNDSFDVNGKSLGLVYGNGKVRMEFGSHTLEMFYGATDIANKTFSTVGDMLQIMNNFLATPLGAANTEIIYDEGRFTMQKKPGAATADEFKINEIDSNNTFLKAMFNNWSKKSYSGQTITTGQFFFQTELQPKADFNSLSSFADAVQNAISGTVISGSEFKAKYLDNYFGLPASSPENEVKIKIDGTVQTFKYVDGTPDQLAGEFNTVKDLADLISRNSGNKLTSKVVSGKIEIRNESGADVTIELDTPTKSDYLNGILNHTATISPSSTYTYNAIDGKGRITYSINSATQKLTGFTITDKRPQSVFTSTVIADNNTEEGQNLGSKGSLISEHFFVKANANTKMIDLFDDNGESCNFTEDYTSIDFTSAINKKAMDSYNFSITADTTLKDMMLAMENYLGLGKEFNSKPNVTMDDNGVIKITGEPGEANNIDYFNMVGYPENIMNVFKTVGQGELGPDATGGIYTSNMSIYDEQGNMHTVLFEFAMLNQERNEWTMNIKTTDPQVKVEIDGAVTNELVMKFNSDGTPNYIYDRFSNPVKIFTTPTMSLTPNNGASTVGNIKMELGTPGTTDGLKIDSATTTISQNQDGYTLGYLEQRNFDEDGRITGVYSNQKTRFIGQIALATFANNRGLMKAGDTLFLPTNNSGTPSIGVALSGDRGKVLPQRLELANVDLSDEFVDMITTQRGFQANSRVVTTSDEMIQELLTLKR